ncbi:MAG: HAMP domain-containing histidine kinase [Oscillospiraceae bacterium]|nr:HAMP domain-containing histidine kinase [Oscillospiraceae bacterium]
MQHGLSRWYVKLLAWLMAAACLVFGVWSAYIVLACLENGLYEDTPYQESHFCVERVQTAVQEVIYQYRSDPSFHQWGKLLQNSDLRFIILEEDSGKVTASYTQGLDMTVPKNLKDNVYLKQSNFYMELGAPGSVFENVYVCDYYFNEDWTGDQSFYYEYEYEYATGNVLSPEDESVMHQILCLLPRHIQVTDDPVGEGFEIWIVWKCWKTDAAVCFALCVIGLLLSLSLLLTQAGRRPGKDEIVTTWFDRIWLEVILAVGALAVVGVMGSFLAMYESKHNVYLTWHELQLIILLCDAAAVCCGMAVIGCLTGLTTRLKARIFWQSALGYKLLKLLWKWVKKPVLTVADVMRRGFASLSLVPVAVLTVLGIMTVEIILFTWLVNTRASEGPLVLLILFNLFVILAAVWGAAQMKKLQQAAKALADGDLEHHLNTDGMYWKFQDHARDLNAIAGGMNKAVEQKMRSEHLKTELITNVSHDIKTPLTSIINYVDLLSKPHTEAEGIQYLEVLQRQALRLKKLTEDLVEASKASTGNITVEPEKLNVLELLEQAIGEYRERLEERNLELVTSVRADLYVLADGKLLWRVMDNLLGNVAKYAMPGTRVYMTARKKDADVVISVKNISQEPLDLDAKDLMERFVRGDLSRHTEGSGLGLNIARSLVKLQNGSFDLTVDGDLFKAEITLPCP